MAGVDAAQRPLKPTRSVKPARAVVLVIWAWRMLASAQFAIALIGCLVVAGLLAVLLPQVPVQIRNNPAAIDAWLVLREDSFGPFTEPLHRMGLFNVVASPWFLSALGLLAVAITVYVLDRFLDVWRNVTQPRRQVPDSFFERAANRVALPSAESAAAVTGRIEAALSKRRFRVRRLGGVAEGDTVYLFADRFAWAQFGNFATHIALVLFLVGGLVTYFGGYTNALLIAEGTTNPVFAVSHPNQMQIEVLDAVASFDAAGSPLDYRSELVIYQGGEEVARGTTTVNDPLLYGGYRFHQGGYFGKGAALRVRDVESGNTIYAEVLALTDLVPAPVIVVRDAGGNVLLDAAIVPTDVIEDVRGALIAVPGTGREFWVGVRQNDPGSAGAWSLVVFDRGQPDAGFVLAGGETLRADGLEWTFAEAIGLPALVSAGLPGDSERTQTVLSQMPDGTPFVTVLGVVDNGALTLFPGEPVVVDGREYVFEGRREFAGIEVRRDPGANLIWVAAGLLIAGLLVTFYLPRMRLWARVREDEAIVAGLAERRGVFQNEAEHLRKELSAARMDGNREPDVPGGDMHE